MLLDLATVLMMVVLVSSVMALAVAVVAWRQPVDGMRFHAALLVFQTLAYLMLAMRGRIDGMGSLVLGNMLIAASHAMLYLAVCEFHKASARAFMTWGPVGVVGLVFFALIEDDRSRVLAGALLFSAQLLPILLLLLNRRHGSSGRGQYLVMLALVIYLGLFGLGAILAALAGPQQTPSPELGLHLVATVLGSFAAAVLIAIGFPLMVYERLEARSRELALIDPLTGARNRRFFDAVAPGEIDRCLRYGPALSLMMIDIDHFKGINDAHGHSVGDQVLRELAARVQSLLRKSDSLTRWGGEEFVVLLPETDQTGAAALAERIRQQVAGQPFVPAGTVTVSIGVARFRPNEGLYPWIDRADAAMYGAKRLGRDRVGIAEPQAPS